MNIHEINPYIRRALHSVLKAPFTINDRIILDYELLYVANGICDITCEGALHRYKKGDIFLIPPNVNHRFDSVTHTDFVQPHIHFDLKYDRFSTRRFINFKTVEDMSEAERQMIGENIFSNKAIQILQPKDKPLFLRLFYETIDLYNSGTASTLAWKGTLCQLLSMVLPDSTETSEKTPPIVEQVKDYLDLNFTNVITLENLSAYFYINKYTLIRKFQAAYGMGVIAYVHHLKLERAKELLHTSTLTVSEISDQLGFDSIYTFSRFFKRHTGVSPKTYAQKKRG